MIEKIKIKEPYWGKRAFGINEEKIRHSTEIEVTCSYKNRQGNLEFPHIYKMDSKQAMTYEGQFRKGVMLRIIPIFDFHVEYRRPRCMN